MNLNLESKIRILFIVNPYSGVTHKKHIDKYLKKMLRPEKFDYKIVFTKYKHHAIELSRQGVDEGYKVFVAVGGDGTVNEVLQATVHSQIILGIIPCGSGNGLARHCGIPLQMSFAVAALKKSTLTLVDVGKANNIYFSSNAGIGFDATVCNAIQQSTSRGLKMYIYQTLRHLLLYRSKTYSIQIENEIVEQKIFMLSVANGKELGYGFQLAPNASLQDGLLDIVILRSFNMISIWKILWDAWHETWQSDTNKTHTRATQLIIKSTHLNYFQADGDAHPCQGECIFTLEKNALQILIPSAEKKL